MEIDEFPAMPLCERAVRGLERTALCIRWTFDARLGLWGLPPIEIPEIDLEQSWREMLAAATAHQELQWYVEHFRGAARPHWPSIITGL